MIVFDRFRIDPDRNRLFEDGRPVKIERLPLATLLLLIRRRGAVVSRQEIADAVWGSGKFVEADEGINTAISKIRRALGENSESPRFISTVVGRGYSFIGSVEEDAVTPPTALAPPSRAGRFLVMAALAAITVALTASW